MWTYKFLNCQQPPQKFIDLALTADPVQYGSRSTTNYYKPGKDPIAKRHLTSCGQEKKSIRLPKYDMPEEFANWVRNHITDKFLEAAVALSDKGNGGGLGPHTDRARDYCLMYVIKSGGDHVRTSFWQERQQPLVRRRFTFIDNYDMLELIDEGNFKEGRWLVMNTLILHSLENVQDRRIAFQITIDHDISDLEKFFI